MMWAVFGLMSLDLLIGLVRSFWSGTFSAIPKMVLDLLKDVLYYVAPLMILMSMIAIDPTGWVLLVLYFLGGLSIIGNYVMAIKNKFTS
ncbi:hypothetical protein [Ammoniphilus sp. 3BR4]|uniref:hypothetical protein n=1 Tax=Ammoniphilus sp. 3BR4 TaxID=3158265 RepID=UPI0034655844